MRKIFLIVLGLLLMTSGMAQKLDVNRQLSYCHDKVIKALKSLKPYDYVMEPRNILEGQRFWNCRKASAEEWCSGFWPGILWMDYSNLEASGGQKREKMCVRRAAEGYTDVLNFLASQPIYDHDLGFLIINSFLKGYESLQATSLDAATQVLAQHYKEIALAAADTLATLYNNKVGTLLSWPRHVKDYGGHNTIMDNMINLELLFWADRNRAESSSATGWSLYDVAVRHAETTMLHHFREDGSCYHVAVYDTLTGQFIKGVTHQGYADWSMWSRGQSWAIYGYTMVYRFTKDRRFLDHAQKVTDIYLKRLHETSDDWVPLWDMDDPRGLLAPKDASAACVVASALLELEEYVDADRSRDYHVAAVSMLADLSSNRYQSRNRNVAFLLHSTGHHPAGSEIDASIIYADYYYMEALQRLKRKE